MGLLGRDPRVKPRRLAPRKTPRRLKVDVVWSSEVTRRDGSTVTVAIVDPGMIGSHGYAGYVVAVQEQGRPMHAVVTVMTVIPIDDAYRMAMLVVVALGKSYGDEPISQLLDYCQISVMVRNEHASPDILDMMRRFANVLGPEYFRLRTMPLRLMPEEVQQLVAAEHTP